FYKWLRKEERPEEVSWIRIREANRHKLPESVGSGCLWVAPKSRGWELHSHQMESSPACPAIFTKLQSYPRKPLFLKS
ncbi:MAG: hypothetical protein ABIL91_07945, partial [candidate division WOR-3 bacterium]